MELNFEGRTALVTGASQGIGRTTARMLALADVNVVVVTRRIALVEQNDVALNLAYRAYVLTRGTLALSGSAEEHRGSDQLRKAYLDMGK